MQEFSTMYFFTASTQKGFALFLWHVKYTCEYDSRCFLIISKEQGIKSKIHLEMILLSHKIYVLLTYCTVTHDSDYFRHRHRYHRYHHRYHHLFCRLPLAYLFSAVRFLSKPILINADKST